MVAIRLTRLGSKNKPFYNIIVVDKKSPRNSNYIERLGYYNPLKTDKLKINRNRVIFFLNYGAQISTKLKNLILKKL